MANNVAVTAGSGTTMATDDVGGVHYPLVKLAVGTEDSAVRIGQLEDAAHASGDAGIMALAVRNDAGTAFAADGDYTPLMVDSAGRLYVNVAAGTLALSGEDHIGEVGGNTTVIRITPTVSTSIYAALDIIGGTQTLTSAMRVSGGSGVLQTITVADDDNEKVALEILLFDSAPSGGTYADQGALAHAAGDIDKFLGKVSIASSDYVTVVTGSLAVATKTVGLPVKAVGSANLYAIILVGSGTPTYTATSDLDLAFGFLRD